MVMPNHRLGLIVLCSALASAKELMHQPSSLAIPFIAIPLVSMAIEGEAGDTSDGRLQNLHRLMAWLASSSLSTVIWIALAVWLFTMFGSSNKTSHPSRVRYQT